MEVKIFGGLFITPTFTVQKTRICSISLNDLAATLREKQAALIPTLASKGAEDS